MIDSPLERFRQALPGRFTAALRDLERAAARGDADARRRLGAIGAAPVQSLLRLRGDGGGELWLRADRQRLEVMDRAPAAGFGYALSLPVEAAAEALDFIERAGDGPSPSLALASLASHEARALFDRTPFAFGLEVTQVPALGTVRIEVALGRSALAPRAEFELRVRHDDIEDALELGLTPQQLFLTGKVQIEGDVAKAMLLAMSLAQLP
jgi:hypothetical protein